MLKEKLPPTASPRAQPPFALWHVSTCLLFFHAALQPPQGPHLPRIGVCDPWSPDSLAHKSSWSTCSSSVSGRPYFSTDVLFPHIHQTILKPPRAIWKFIRALSHLRVFICLLLYHCLPGPGSSTLQTWAWSRSAATPQVWPVAIRYLIWTRWSFLPAIGTPE